MFKSQGTFYYPDQAKLRNAQGRFLLELIEIESGEGSPHATLGEIGRINQLSGSLS